MYHHHSQQEGPPQPFSNRPGPFHHQEQAHQQQQQQQQHSHFQYPPNMGSRDMDMVPMDIEMGLDRMNGSGSGGYSSTPQPLSESQPGHQQGLDWSNYQHPGQMFSSSPSTVTQQPQNSHSAMGTQAWTHAPVYEPPSPQTRGSHSRGVDRQGIPESAGSILASFGLSSQDMEVLSQYPEDQLTPDKLPYILQDMLSRKSNDHDIAASSSSSYSQSAIRAARETLPPPSCSQRSSERWQSPEGSSLRSVAQTAGKCIDYGHSSLATDVSSSREAFIREPLSSERKMVSRCPPMDMPERWHVRPQPAETNRHPDLDYRRSSGEVLNSKRSPAAEFPLPPRSRRPDLDYRRDCPKRSPSSETRSDYSTSSRRPAPLSSLSKSRDGTKRLPTPSMICDFSAESPKVYPHTCTLCLIDFEQAKGWSEHVKSAKHTDSCRNLHNKREPHSLRQDDSRTPKERSPSRSVSARRERTERERERLKREDHGRGKDPRPSSIHSPNRSNRGSSSSSSHRPERRAHHSPAAAGRSSRDSLKRPRDKSATRDDCSARSKLPSSAKSPIKMTPKAGSKITKPGSKADETSAKGPPAKKVSTPSSQSTKAASHLVHLTGVPTTVTEEEVTDLVGGFEKINSVVLLARNEAEEEEEKQKAATPAVLRSTTTAAGAVPGGTTRVQLTSGASSPSSQPSSPLPQQAYRDSGASPDDSEGSDDGSTHSMDEGDEEGEIPSFQEASGAVATSPLRDGVLGASGGQLVPSWPASQELDSDAAKREEPVSAIIKRALARCGLERPSTAPDDDYQGLAPQDQRAPRSRKVPAARGFARALMSTWENHSEPARLGFSLNVVDAPKMGLIACPPMDSVLAQGIVDQRHAVALTPEPHFTAPKEKLLSVAVKKAYKSAALAARALNMVAILQGSTAKRLAELKEAWGEDAEELEALQQLTIKVTRHATAWMGKSMADNAAIERARWLDLAIFRSEVVDAKKSVMALPLRPDNLFAGASEFLRVSTDSRKAQREAAAGVLEPAPPPSSKPRSERPAGRGRSSSSRRGQASTSRSSSAQASSRERAHDAGNNRGRASPRQPPASNTSRPPRRDTGKPRRGARVK